MIEQHPRLSLSRLAPDSYRAMREFAHTSTRAAELSGIEQEIVHLIHIRVSQINACPFCIALHTGEAEAAGIAARKIYLLDAWEHAPQVFSAGEQAALGLAEAVTRLRPGAVPDEVYDLARKYFTERQVAELIFVTTVMNAWNRLAISARMTPDTGRRV